MELGASAVETYVVKLRKLVPLAKLGVLLCLSIAVFLPCFYLFSFIALKWNEVYGEIFANPLIGDQYWIRIQKSLALSFKIALIAVAVDLLLGIPLAYLLARREFRGRSLIEDLATLPLVVPTSGFGFAALMTWASRDSPLAALGLRASIDAVVPVLGVPLLILLVHISLTFPYVVRTVAASLRDLERAYEVVSASLGARPLTTFRKVTLPLVLPGLLSGSVLAFARSLGETGATMIVAGVSTTAPIAIVRWEFEGKVAPAAFLGALLVALALAAILPVEYLLYKRGVPALGASLGSLEDVLVKIERSVGRRLSRVRDAASLAFLALAVVLPVATLFRLTAAYWSAEPYTGRYEGSVLYQLFGPSRYVEAIARAIGTSIIAASLSTFLSAYIAVLAVLYIAKSRGGGLVRALLKIPLVVPTSALGLSMILLWGPRGLGLVEPGIWLIVLTHIVFSVPVIVETSLASYREVGVELYEETARTLGATPHGVIETVTLPMIKRGVLAGSLLAFAHSLGETGATFIVMGEDVTVSTLVVSMVESLAIPAALFASSLLVCISVGVLALIRTAKLG